MSNSAFSFVDAYSLRARAVPALLAIAPAIAFVLAIGPGVSSTAQIFSGVAVAALTYAFSDVARRLGKRVEPKLHEDAGGLSSIVMMRYRDSTFDSDAKARYLSFLAKNLGKKAPTRDSELANPEEADKFYKSCGDWIRENTRDTEKFRILFAENITYGFRRNLYGLKIFGISINILVTILVSLHIYFGEFRIIGINMGNGAYYVLMVSIVHAFYLIFFARKSYVLEASRQYARQLILSCEILMKKK